MDRNFDICLFKEVNLILYSHHFICDFTYFHKEVDLILDSYHFARNFYASAQRVFGLTLD